MRVEMMRTMASERGGIVYGMDDRYCIDNGAMIAQAGMLQYESGQRDLMEDTFCTQRFRTDEVHVGWRQD